MAEMLIQSESLTPIADQIRVLSGTEDAMSLNAMANAVHTENVNFESNLTAQDDLISQIMTALEGKAAGGGNLSYDTCTVNISTSNIDEMNGVAYVTVNSDGEIESVLNKTMASSYSLTCLCGSVVVVAVPGHVDTRLTKATNLGWLVNSNCRIYGITASKNEVATVIINANIGGSND